MHCDTPGSMLHLDDALALRLERTLAMNAVSAAQGVARLFPETGACVERLGVGWLLYAGPGMPINRAVGLGLEQAFVEEHLEQVEAFYRDRGLPAEVDLYPLTHPALPEALQRRGYGAGRFLNAHARRVGFGPLPPPSAHIGIRAATPEEFGLWAETAVRCGDGTEEVASDNPFYRLARAVIEQPEVTGYLARCEGQVVGAGGLSVREAVATLFSTSVHPVFRQRGVQTALINARLAAAAAASCDLVLTTTVPGSPSERNVRRAGFQALYTRMIARRAPGTE